jgi:GT2 family glycosyltransferase
MIDVIIPTLFRGPIPFLMYTLKELEGSDLVDNIFIIDNSEKPLTIGFGDKVTVKKQEKNIYVNPSWNLGMSIPSDNKYFLIMNDDILCKGSVLTDLYKALEQFDDIGIATCHTHVDQFPDSDYNLVVDAYDKHNKTGPIKIQDFRYGQRIGWFMFGRRTAWRTITDDLKIFYGDDIIYRTSSMLGFRNVCLESNIIAHQQSSTLNSERETFNPVADIDHKRWREEYKHKWQ